MTAFRIDSYDVVAGADHVTGNKVEYLYKVILRGTPDPDSTINLAEIVFTAPRQLPYPGEVLADSIQGFRSYELFASWYEILRSEKQIKFRYSQESGSRNLTHFRISTEPDPSDKGSTDVT